MQLWKIQTAFTFTSKGQKKEIEKLKERLSDKGAEIIKSEQGDHLSTFYVHYPRGNDPKTFYKSKTFVALILVLATHFFIYSFPWFWLWYPLVLFVTWAYHATTFGEPVKIDKNEFAEPIRSVAPQPREGSPKTTTLIPWELTEIPSSLDSDKTFISSNSGKSYTVNLSKLTCTCPDFIETRSEFDRSSPLRLCKHLAESLIEPLANVLEPWELSALDSIKEGYRRRKYGIVTENGAIFAIGYDDRDWVNIFYDNKLLDCGRRFYGYNPHENRWAYGEYPDISHDIEEWIESNLNDLDMEEEEDSNTYTKTIDVSELLEKALSGRLDVPDRKVHALPGTYDESYFTNANTGKFKFPNYRHYKKYLVKIDDCTDYKEDYWLDLEADEKRSYSMKNFEFEFMGPDLEIDTLEDSLDSIVNKHFKDYKPLLENRELFTDLLDIANGVSHVEIDRYMLKSEIGAFIDCGLVTISCITSDEEKIDAFEESFTLEGLKSAARTKGLPVSGSKLNLAQRLAENGWEPGLVKVSIETDAIQNTSKAISEKYIEEVETNLGRFHPLYHKECWDIVSYSNDGFVSELAKDRLQSEYWEQSLSTDHQN